MRSRKIDFDLKKWEESFSQIENFLKQNSPLPFIVYITWLQVKAYYNSESAMKVFDSVFKLDQDSKSHKIKAPFRRQQFTVLANLYVQYCLVPLKKYSKAKYFLKFVEEYSICESENVQNLNSFVSNFQTISKGKTKVLKEKVEETETLLLTEESKEKKKVEIKLSVEELGGMFIFFIFSILLSIKRKLILAKLSNIFKRLSELAFPK